MLDSARSDHSPACDSLSRILGPVTWKDENAFSLGLTATPVEIDAGQWINTIDRLARRNDGVTIDYPKAEIEAAVSSYVSVVEDLRTGVPDESMATRFESMADRFTDRASWAGRGIVRAKTGSLRDVSTLAGYLVTAQGAPLVFALTANQVRLPNRTRQWMDRTTAAWAACGCP